MAFSKEASPARCATGGGPRKIAHTGKRRDFLAITHPPHGQSRAETVVLAGVDDDVRRCRRLARQAARLVRRLMPSGVGELEFLIEQCGALEFAQELSRLEYTEDER
jgi:hypothetical protein